MTTIRVYRSPKVEVRDASICGRGIFAKEQINKGEIVAIKAGHIVNQGEVKQLTATIGDFSLQIHDDFYLSPRTEDEDARGLRPRDAGVSSPRSRGHLPGIRGRGPDPGSGRR